MKLEELVKTSEEQEKYLNVLLLLNCYEIKNPIILIIFVQ